jgi:hypothetical protein
MAEAFFFSQIMHICLVSGKLNKGSTLREKKLASERLKEDQDIMLRMWQIGKVRCSVERAYSPWWS